LWNWKSRTLRTRLPYASSGRYIESRKINFYSMKTEQWKPVQFHDVDTWLQDRVNSFTKRLYFLS
jgi:hypothetical protein